MMRRLIAAGTLLVLTPILWAAAQTPLQTAQQAFQEGRFGQAAATLEQAAQTDPNNAALHFWLARCYFEVRNYEQASKEEEKAVRLDGERSEYHFWLGRIYGRMAELHSSLWLGIKTRKEFDTAVEIDPKNIPARRALMEFYVGAPWIVGGSKSRARDQVAAIAAQNPVQGALAQADYDHMLGDQAGASREYQKVIDMGASNPTEYYEAADFYAARSDATGLERAIDGVLRIAPSDPRLGYYRGVLLAIRGVQLEEAERYLKAFLAATVDRTDYPSHANARTWLGHIYEQMGRQMEAAEQYRAALQIDPNLRFAKQSLQILEKQMN
jgi:tetratricopeptide (TPR) repeat protein